jgi:hypothetical protein
VKRGLLRRSLFSIKIAHINSPAKRVNLYYGIPIVDNPQGAKRLGGDFRLKLLPRDRLCRSLIRNFNREKRSASQTSFFD